MGLNGKQTLLDDPSSVKAVATTVRTFVDRYDLYHQVMAAWEKAKRQAE